jgi:hypothetical protein
LLLVSRLPCSWFLSPEKKEKSLKQEDESSENDSSNSRPEESSNPSPDTRDEDPADPTGDTSAEPPEVGPETVSTGATADQVTSSPGVSSGAIVGIVIGGIVVVVGFFLAGRRTRDGSRSSPPSPASKSKPMPALKVGSPASVNVDESSTDLDVPSQSVTDLDGPTESSDVHDMPSRRDEV